MTNNIQTIGGQKKLGPNALKHVSDHFFARRFFTLDAGVPFSEVFRPAFWSNHKLNEHDLIRVRAHDGSFDCELTVISCQQGGAVVDIYLAAAIKAQRAPYEPKPCRKLCGAKRKRDGQPCTGRAMPKTGRCKWHGGKSTGPRTLDGRARIAESNRRRACARPS